MSTKEERYQDKKDSLHIIEKYDQAVNYLYPISQSMPRGQGRFRDKFLETLLAVPGLVYTAAKSGQISRIYLADAGLAEIRWMLRFAAHPGRKLMTRHQQEVAETHLAEVGAMIGSWIQRKSKR